MTSDTITLNGKTYEITNYDNVIFKSGDRNDYLILKEIPQPQTPQTQTHEWNQAGNVSQGKSESLKPDSEKQSVEMFSLIGGAGLKTGETHNQEEDFCLSDKIGKWGYNDDGTPDCDVMDIDYIKEFIRRLKKKVCCCEYYKPSGEQYECCNCKAINALAGIELSEKLRGEK